MPTTPRAATSETIEISDYSDRRCSFHELIDVRGSGDDNACRYGIKSAMDGNEPSEHTYDSPRSYCTLAIDELGLETYSIDETIKATGDSYLKLGLLPD